MKNRSLTPFLRALPARANLEHLKNEAKQRLKMMRSHNPTAQLSEAQLLLARDYGFPSWRKMKSYVDALNHIGERLINAVRDNELKKIREVLDRHPELVKANTEIDQRALMPGTTRERRRSRVRCSHCNCSIWRLSEDILRCCGC
jgi:hypothetical protein